MDIVASDVGTRKGLRWCSLRSRWSAVKQRPNPRLQADGGDRAGFVTRWPRRKSGAVPPPPLNRQAFGGFIGTDVHWQVTQEPKETDDETTIHPSNTWRGPVLRASGVGSALEEPGGGSPSEEGGSVRRDVQHGGRQGTGRLLY